ncbi:hypothetical protein BKA63DRAFT_499 [Paraphoma chrysanthemicola]|nr:hypothetical protein BKA63DRAFT_499 [Paraphoma chrysanthemicola]
MQYDRILRLALIPSIIFLLLSLVSLALTTHYWILGDWILPQGVRVITGVNQQTQVPTVDYTFAYFKDNETNVTVASGCLCLAAAVIALIAWSTLRKPGMDTQFAAGTRRFWILAVVVMSVTGAAVALASLAMHYSEKGSDQFGCDSETLMMAGKMNTNKECTREMAACNFLPRYVRGSDRSNAAIACNEAVVVKWLQLILVINALIVLALFSVQARVRRTTRYSRPTDPLPKEI